MNRLQRLTLRFAGVAASVILFGSVVTAQEQKTPPPAPAQTPSAAPNPFAPSPAPPLPAGMTGADVNDPRYKLTPGMYDAGETSMGLKHVLLLKKPDAFQLGTDRPDDPKVIKTIQELGMGDASKMPMERRLPIAQLAFANSDLAFEGNHLFMGELLRREHL